MGLWDSISSAAGRIGGAVSTAYQQGGIGGIGRLIDRNIADAGKALSKMVGGVAENTVGAAGKSMCDIMGFHETGNAIQKGIGNLAESAAQIGLDQVTGKISAVTGAAQTVGHVLNGEYEEAAKSAALAAADYVGGKAGGRLAKSAANRILPGKAGDAAKAALKDGSLPSKTLQDRAVDAAKKKIETKGEQVGSDLAKQGVNALWDGAKPKPSEPQTPARRPDDNIQERKAPDNESLAAKPPAEASRQPDRQPPPAADKQLPKASPKQSPGDARPDWARDPKFKEMIERIQTTKPEDIKPVSWPSSNQKENTQFEPVLLPSPIQEEDAQFKPVPMLSP